ncbi:MAG: exopolysaccharide biosynthesis protein [Allorhizobium sp.]
MPEAISTVTQLLDKIDQKRQEQSRVTIHTLQEIAGHRVSGPLLLVPGLVIVSPLSGIPTLPTILAVVIGLVSVQLLFGRRSIWLPGILERAGISSSRAEKAISFLRPVAAFIDRVSTKRFSWLSGPIPVRITSLLCLLVAFAMPLMELVPFSSSLAGVVVAVAGLALMTGDGLLFALVCLLIATGTVLGAMLLF